jgi:putative NADH-flavin reductase
VKLAIFGGTGRVGQQVVRLARERGHQVTLLAREPGEDAPGVARVVGDVLSQGDVERVVAGHDAIVSTLGVPDYRNPGMLLEDGMRTICTVARAHGVRRVVALAGAGVLDHPAGGLRQEQASFPEPFRAISRAHAGTWRALQDSRLDWTLVCTGDQVPGGDAARVVVEADRYPDATNRVGIEDIAAFMLDQVTDQRFLARRVGLAWK